MKTSRLEAFSDGVLAIIITIMVLAFEPPDSAQFESLAVIVPTLLSYVISFVFVGMYWSNHHHLLHATETISGKILWLNLNLLFWLSLIPFSTAWMDDQLFAHIPVAIYGLILFCCAVAYYVLRREITRKQEADSVLKQEVEMRRKMAASMALQLMGIAMAFFYPWVAVCFYLASALFWAVPEKVIEESFS
ncbi:MAG: DUF1211 domain-containing protein [Pseudomonadales bacterium]|nr:DUF1211 domain-containing protein [Pseudomonadales bacterium]